MSNTIAPTSLVVGVTVIGFNESNPCSLCNSSTSSFILAKMLPASPELPFVFQVAT